MRISRRKFVAQAGLATGLGFAGLRMFSGCENPQTTTAALDRYGLPVPDPDKILNLPEGFNYKIISRSGEAMTDGLIVPGSPDGMAAFPGSPGRTILVRNHELNTSASPSDGPFGTRNENYTPNIARAIYDDGFGNPCLGGTTTIVINNESLEVEKQFLSLTGTVRNCAGGPTPWGSWITCEETEKTVGERCSKDHGYAFDVKATEDDMLQEATPILPMGRFNREAVAVEPETHIVYQTEDKSDGLFYRFVPDDPTDLHAGGRQQALAFVDQDQVDTRNWDSMDIPVSTPFAVRWIDLEDIHSPENDLRFRGFASGAARFARGEGIWYGDGVFYIACTNGGLKKAGQIWKYRPSAAEGTANEAAQPGHIELFIQPDQKSLLENADNLTVAPSGDLFVCEDGPGKQNIVGVTPDGALFRFAENVISESEFAGATFSPDGSVLFVNIQKDGLTFAITGPWA